MTQIHERLAKLEVSDTHQAKKINEIHKALIGNGQPGIIAEMNQFKGGSKLFGAIISVFIGILSLAVGILAYIK